MYRRLPIFALALAPVLAQPLFADNVYREIPEGNIAALKSELFAARGNRDGLTTLVMGGTYRFGPADELPEIITDVLIRGHFRPVHLAGKDGGPVTLFRIGSAGSLKLTNVEIEDFDLGVIGTGSASGERGLIFNRGELRLDMVQFKDNTTVVSCGAEGCTNYKPLITNTAAGEIRATQVSVVNVGAGTNNPDSDSSAGAFLDNSGIARLRTLQFRLEGKLHEPPFRNTGQMWLTNTTLASEVSGNAYKKDWIVSQGHLRLVNTVVAGFAAGWCDTAISGGHNLVDNPSCGISRQSDIVGDSAGLLWRPVAADWIRREGEQILTHAWVPMAASPAVDSADVDACSRYSLHTDVFMDSYPPQDGDGDGVARCDRGSYELSRSFIEIGGINGLYFNPQADGHYVYVTDTRYNTMVMWTTFDRDGKQAWIFGIADEAVAGRSLIADAYISRDGRVSLDGQLDAATVEPWGRLELELTSCDEGQFTFVSEVPGFASGQFEITRLAHVRRLGCAGFTQDD